VAQTEVVINLTVVRDILLTRRCAARDGHMWCTNTEGFVKDRFIEVVLVVRGVADVDDVNLVGLMVSTLMLPMF
jgi:hypothetical protein